MFLINVEKCLSLFDEVYVSSDSWDILKQALLADARPIKRGEELCGDTPNIPVYQHALKFMKDVDGIVAVQANSPNIKTEVIKKCKEYLEQGYQEVMTCYDENPDNKVYGSVWAITKERLLNYGDPYKPNPDMLVNDESIDIHTIEDYNKVNKLFT